MVIITLIDIEGIEVISQQRTEDAIICVEYFHYNRDNKMHLLRVLRQNRLNIIGPIRCFCDGKSKNETDNPLDDPNHPITRTGRLLKGDFNEMKKLFVPGKRVIGSDGDIRDNR